MVKKPRILPLVWLLIALLAMAALHRWAPLARLVSAPWTWAGLVPVAFGIWMMVASARSFLRAETGLVPFDEARVLVTGGFFRYSRNPMYLGMALLLAGAAVVHGTVSTVAPVAGFVAVIRRQFIAGEEALLEATFGDQYRAYKARVRRWL